MAGDAREVDQAVREGGLHDQRFEAAHLARHLPEPLSGPSVAAVDEAGLSVVNHVPRRRNGVDYGYRSDPQIADPGFNLVEEAPKAEHGVCTRRDRGEVRPERVVERVDAQ